MNLSRTVLYYGTDAAPPGRINLRAGPLSMIFDAGDLRYIRLPGEVEIARRIYVALRDRNWGTLPLRLLNFRQDTTEDSFRLSYDAESKQNDIDFFWKATLTGDANGTIHFNAEGEARSTFLRNRLGVCLLHPVRECAGAPCTVETVDGTIISGIWPLFISPHQPFLNIRAISHEVVSGLWAEARFHGEIFEMEDQRNWSDASYKTYSTPLGLPYPVEVKVGAKISQSVTLSLKGVIPKRSDEFPQQVVRFTVSDKPPVELPRLGLSLAGHGQPPSPNELLRLQHLNLSHLRVDLNLGQPAHETRLIRASDHARQLGVPLEVAVIVTDQAAKELGNLRELVDKLKPLISTWLIFHAAENSTGEKWIRLARDLLSIMRRTPGLELGH